MKILIADDQEATRQMYTLMLQDYRVDIVEAQDGEEAVDLAMIENPELILLDHKMPGMSGYDVVHKIRQNDDLKRVPILFITGSNMDQTLQDMIKFEANDFLQKPVTVDSLTEAIEKVLKKPLPKKVDS